MSGEGRGDDVYQPDGSDVANRPTDDLDPENVIDEPDLDDILDTGYSPPEKPLGVSKYGTTGEEQREGESLDRRLAQEQPEQDPFEPAGTGEEPESNGPSEEEAGDERAGRVAPTEEPGDQRHNRVLGRDVGVDGGAASAEEAAVHIQDEDDGA
ncbi:DUF5709 domain-containing protein [Streptomyces sp. NBC_01754]|uniref:DUF5709 domain-containing protein n=1 Tax=Streptomyces sp. NBC_01754 TaxID=2975930 RepID=UPI002DD91C59|nr:DUF5709 domain-containing protein [Streptomyces sp. NBC_01754]WSC96202.1 DUF5709 domain-containing protein [Streptomyces sp. NBC_01754]